MKIIGQSVLVDGNPYVHLGYVAATKKAIDSKTMGITAVLSITGAVLLAIALVRMVMGISRGVRRAIVLSIMVGVLGLVLLFGGFLYLMDHYRSAREVRANPRLWTDWQAHEGMSKVRGRLKSAGTRPSVAELQQEFSGRFVDGWETSMRLEARVVDGKVVYRVVSAGPDRQFGTGDDVVSAEGRE